MKDKINLDNKESIFKTGNLKYIDEDPANILIDCVAVLLRDYGMDGKYAAKLLLKALLKDEFLKNLLKDIEKFRTGKKKLGA